MSKRYADVLMNDKYKRISIWNMINLKLHDPRKYEYIKDKIYSTHKKSENKCRMNFRFNEDAYYKSFFRYNPKIERLPTGEGYEESATHEAYKDIIANLTELRLEINGKEVVLFITESEIEHTKIVNGNRYVVDVHFWFNKSIPNYYVSKWSGELAFEIKYKHPTSEIKKFDFTNCNIAMFEHKVSPKLLLENCQNELQEKEEMEFIKQNYLSKIIYGKLLSDPESEEYKEMKELEESKSMIVSLQKQLNEQSKIISNYDRQLSDTKKQIKNKEIELFDLCGQLQLAKEELEKIKNTRAYKWLIKK